MSEALLRIILNNVQYYSLLFFIMELLVLIFLGLLLSVMILPWVNLARLNRYRKELESLKAELSALRSVARPVQRRDAAQSPVVQLPKVSAAVDEPISKSKLVPPPIPKAVNTTEKVRLTDNPVDHTPKTQGIGPGLESDLAASAPVLNTEVSSRTSEKVAKEPVDEAQDWFSKLAVWIGGVALLMAGFYMVKYSIDSGWVTPRVRVWITTVFGLLLCGSGVCIGLKAKLSANERIGQALSGAGVACLYFAAYAAVHLYHLIGVSSGFACMVFVTLLAVALSLKNGAPIALMGLVGGFLTPLLMQAETADTVLLFSYLFLLFCGAQYLCLRRGWWGILLGSLIGVYLWSLYVIGCNLNQSVHYLEGAMLFVIGICAVSTVWAVFMKESKLTEKELGLISLIRVLAWGGGLSQSLALVWLSGFSGVDMSLFAVLSVGALVLAVLKEKQFLWASWMALVAVSVATTACSDLEGLRWFIWPTCMSLVFFFTGHWRSLHSTHGDVWRAVSQFAMLSLAPLLYVNRELVAFADAPFEGFFFVVSCGAVLLILGGAEHLLRRKTSMDTIGELTAYAFLLLAFGFWTYLPLEYFVHTTASLWILGLVYLKVRSLGRAIVLQLGLGFVWVVCMLPYAVGAWEYYLGNPVANRSLNDGLTTGAWWLGVLALILSNFLILQDSREVRIGRWCLGVAALFTIVSTYQWLDAIYMPDAWLSVTVEGGLTALMVLVALMQSYFATRYRRSMVGTYVVMALVLLRIVGLHLGDSSAEGERFFLNALLLQFGVPFCATFAIAWMCGEGKHEAARRFYQTVAMLLGFVWSSFLVQDYFGGNYLLPDHPSSAQLYTYSVVWLLLAVAYQSIGLWRNQRVIHGGSLVLLLLTVGKVFLVDASELEGIFRVFSFLGLGVALIGIGFFYNKVVFARQQSEH